MENINHVDSDRGPKRENQKKEESSVSKYQDEADERHYPNYNVKEKVHPERSCVLSLFIHNSKIF